MVATAETKKIVLPQKTLTLQHYHFTALIAMMKISLLGAWLMAGATCLSALSVQGQDLSVSGNLSVNGGMVGGTLHPGNATVAGTLTTNNDLTVYGWSYLKQRVMMQNAGVAYTIESTGGGLSFYPNYAWQSAIRFNSDLSVSVPGKVSIGDVTCSTPSLCTGPLGINTLTLAVGGKIGARGGIHVVGFGGTWPDYVFAPAYRLTPLKEVEQYIQANNHLPEIPSTAQVQAEGIELMAMEALLLKKVEELTLHLIEMQKVNEALAQRVRNLEN